MSQNTTIHTDYLNLIVNEKVKANAMTNVTYGGGVHLEPNHQSSAPFWLLLQLLVSVPIWQALFLARKSCENVMKDFNIQDHRAIP